MNDQIYQDLKSLHLSGMAQSWMLLHETRKLGELTLQDGMAVLIQAEHDQRTNNRTARLLSQARFRYNASIEELAFNTAQGRDKNQILSLATCEYIKQGASVLVTGPAGVGKASSPLLWDIRPASPDTKSGTPICRNFWKICIWRE